MQNGNEAWHILKNLSNISITCRKDVTYDNIMITKKQGFTFSLEDTFF